MPRRLFAKVFFAFAILIIAISAAAYFLAKPILLLVAEKELQKISRQSSIRDMRITANFIEFQGIEIKKDDFCDLKVEGIRISYDLRSILKRKAEFHIKDISCNKLKIGDMAGKIKLGGNVLSVNPILADFLGGSVEGEFDISLDKEMNYFLILKTSGLEIKRFVDDMEFNEKFNMTGRMNGGFSLSGSGQGIKDIKGDFRADPGGGILVIKDKTFLENIAKQSNQPLDIIVESFKNYNYNKGIVNMGVESGDLVMEIKLDGEAGKRNLTVVLHDFNNKEEKP